MDYWLDVTLLNSGIINLELRINTHYRLYSNTGQDGDGLEPA